MQNQKRGQFYLIAALIIIAIVVSLVVVYNVTRVSEEAVKVYDLSSEINFEQSQVIDNGIFTEKSSDVIKDRIKSLAQAYQNLNPDIDFQIAYGTETNICFLGSDENRINIIETQLCENLENSGGTVMISGTNLEFDLKSGQVFYLVVTKTKDGETFVVAPEARGG